MDQVISELVPPPERDPGLEAGDLLDQGRDDTYAAYDYLSAMYAEGLITPAEVRDWLGEEYRHVELFEPAPDGEVLRPIHELRGGERQAVSTLMDSELDGVGGARYAAYRDHYDARGSFQAASARDAEAHRTGQR